MEIHASTPEILWTLVALAGVVFRARLLRDALADHHASIEYHWSDPALAVIVAGRIRGELVGITIKTGFVAIGVWAMTQPNPPKSIGQVIVTIVFILSVVLLDLNSWLTDRDRAKLRRYMEEHE